MVAEKKPEQTITIHYPPDNDGTLSIGVQERQPSDYSKRVEYTVRFTIAAQRNEPSWEALVRAAKAILNQDSRRKGVVQQYDRDEL